jgi:ATP-dependent Clp protease ATP-binding subunit ClpA
MGMADRFDKFTVGARRVLQYAQEEAQRFNHNHIGTEHILLGLIREGEGVAAKVLANAGIKLEKVRHGVEFTVGRGSRMVTGVIGLTPRAKKVIELAVDEVRRLDHRGDIGTEYLLLGLLAEGSGVGIRTLESLGVDPDELWSQTLEMVGAPASPRPRRPATPPNGQPGTPPPSTSNRPQVDVSLTVLPLADLTTLSAPLDDRARQVFPLAFQEAMRRQDCYVGTEHVLLGLLGERDGIAGQILAELTVTREKVDEQLESLPGEGDRKPPGLKLTGLLAFTARAKRSIELAVQEARSRGASLVGTEHLLLGLLAGGAAAEVLERLEISPEAVRAAVERRL